MKKKSITNRSAFFLKFSVFLCLCMYIYIITNKFVYTNNFGFLSTDKRNCRNRKEETFYFMKLTHYQVIRRHVFQRSFPSYFRFNFIPCHELNPTVGMHVSGNSQNCIRPSGDRLQRKAHISKTRQVELLFTINQWPLIIEVQSIIELK